MQYILENEEIIKSRLIYFPKPKFLLFEESRSVFYDDSIEIYLDDFADDKAVFFPIRFDFDSDEKTVKDVIHPISHLTLGQYENCRIPVNRVVTPYEFITFILSNFYDRKYIDSFRNISNKVDLIKKTITDNEERLLHIHLPLKS